MIYYLSLCICFIDIIYNSMFGIVFYYVPHRLLVQGLRLVVSFTYQQSSDISVLFLLISLLTVSFAHQQSSDISVLFLLVSLLTVSFAYQKSSDISVLFLLVFLLTV